MRRVGWLALWAVLVVCAATSAAVAVMMASRLDYLRAFAALVGVVMFSSAAVVIDLYTDGGGEA